MIRVFLFAVANILLLTAGQASQSEQETVRKQTFSPLFGEESVEKLRSCEVPRAERAKTRWSPRFDYSMPKRYGHDRKFYTDLEGRPAGNGIIDLPNNLAYVMNFDSGSDEQSDSCPCPFDNPRACQTRAAARFRVHFTAEPSAQVPLPLNDSASCRRALDNEPSFQWERVVNGEREVFATGPEASLCLPEGGAEVTLRLFHGSEQSAVTRTIQVIDHLIVNFGDSYGAGEGAPEKNHRPEGGINLDNRRLESIDWKKNVIKDFAFFDRWADPGYPIPQKSTKVYAYKEVEWFPYEAEVTIDGVRQKYSYPRYNDDKRTYESRPRLPDWMMIREERDTTYATLFDHHNGHRSAFTHSSQLALFLEEQDDKSSVTYVNLAQSGATIDIGILGRYSGTNDFKANGNSKTYLPKRGGQVGDWPQITSFKRLIGTRSADHLYVSVGGNDVGFANAITALIASDSADVSARGFDGHADDTKRLINAVRTGNWKKNGFGALADDAIPDHQIPGLFGLREKYEELDEAFDELKDDGQLDGPITLIQPPYFGSRRYTGSFSTSFDYVRRVPNSNIYYCWISPFDGGALGKWVRMTSNEFQFAEDYLFKPLVDRMNGTKRLGWRVIDQGDLPGEHGICGDAPYDHYKYRPLDPRTMIFEDGDSNEVRWYRNPADGAAIQRGDATSNKAMFHPNEYGYAHAARLLLADLEEADGLVGAQLLEHSLDGDPNDTLDEAISQIALSESWLETTLRGSHDVNVYTVARPTCRPTTVYALGRGGRGAMTITVFKPNGEVVVSSDPSISPTPDVSRDLSFLGRSESKPKIVVRRPGAVQRLPSDVIRNAVMYAETSCPADPDRPPLGAPVEGDGNARVSYLPDQETFYFVAISHRDNRDFDPVTGRGDNRSEKDRTPLQMMVRVSTP